MLLIFILIAGGVNLPSVPFVSGGAAVDESGHVAVISRADVKIFNDKLELIHTFSGEKNVNVFQYKNGFLVTDMGAKKSTYIKAGMKQSEFSDFFPRVFQRTKDESLFFLD